VFVLGFDPGALGLVKSLALPGGNVTGFSVFNDELIGKRLSLLKRTVPDVRKVGMLVREGDARAATVFEATQRIAAAQGIELLPLRAHDRDGIARAIARGAASGATALLAVPDSLWLTERGQIVEACLRHRLAASFGAVDFADDGLLMAYSPAFVPMFYRAAEVVDRILRGASPAAIPVQQATSFEFVINLKTARALGINVPNAVLLQATRVIE
jgi:putative ABC transport system substrate-binding protein